MINDDVYEDELLNGDLDPMDELPEGEAVDNFDLDINEIVKLVDEAGLEALTPDEEAIYNEVFGEETIEQLQSNHYDNLAEQMDQTDLSFLAQQVQDWVEIDDDSREDWRIREARGVAILGVSDKTEGGAKFAGASRVVHPLLIEAMTQFQSRAIAELWPPEGPVKGVVLGTPTPESNDQAKRVQDYMNYLYLQEMPGAFEETDKMLFRLPLSGSCFKKTFYCPIEGTFISRMVEPTDFIVPYSASDLITTPRFTHRFYEYVNDIKKRIHAGIYLDSNPVVSGETPDYRENVMKDAIDSTEGREDNQDSDSDQPHTMYEMYVDLELDVDQDIDEQTRKPTGIARPYIVTVDKEDLAVLRIQRNWKPSDPRKRKKINVVHYRFMPGFGFYGFGLLHLIGGLTAAATGTLRALLDSGGFANMQAGYRSRDVRIQGGEEPLAPGEWREVNTSTENLKNAFFPVPYKEPSQTLFNLLGYLDERGQRFASTTENMVGDASNQAPVGTTLALIEQGSKVATSIHKRLHNSQGQEFKILHDLNYEYLPDEGYPYLIKGNDGMIMAQDFDGRVDVIPVSDPAIISNTQRITQAQIVIDLADKHPKVISEREAVRRMLEIARIPDIETLMIPESTEPTPEEKTADLDNAKTEAEIGKIESETVNKSIESTYSAVQSAGALALQPELIPTADSILQSSGFDDKNAAPVATVGPGPVIPVNATDGNIPPDMSGQLPPPNKNTSPMFPALPENPDVGMNTGIETQSIEDNDNQ